ncbi:MAG: TIGR02449 family protein [Spongiibacteraceae bacterium]
MDEQSLNLLDRKVSELIKLCDQLDRENRAMKADAQHWKIEREQLIEKTDIARNRVESMIQRLRALEKET